MSFRNEYKYLDNLCKSFSEYPNGISSYIETMEHCTVHRYRCMSWESDYKKLKNLRWKRNEFSHTNGIDEENICDPEDEEWVVNLHSRILNQTDPLCLYFKAESTQSQQTAVQKKVHQPSQQSSFRPDTSHNLNQKSGGYGLYLALFATVMITVALVLTYCHAFK